MEGGGDGRKRLANPISFLQPRGETGWGEDGKRQKVQKRVYLFLLTPDFSKGRKQVLRRSGAVRLKSARWLCKQTNKK